MKSSSNRCRTGRSFSLSQSGVSQRIYEVGIRRALGAWRSDIFWMIVKHGMALLGLGWVTGQIAALGLTRFLSTFLFEISSLDTITFVAAGVFFLFVGFVACAIPALRAVRPVNCKSGEAQGRRRFLRKPPAHAGRHRPASRARRGLALREGLDEERRRGSSSSSL